MLIKKIHLYKNREIINDKRKINLINFQHLTPLAGRDVLLNGEPTELVDEYTYLRQKLTLNEHTQHPKSKEKFSSFGRL